MKKEEEGMTGEAVDMEDETEAGKEKKGEDTKKEEIDKRRSGS